MLTAWTKEQVNRLYRKWSGPDPHVRPEGILFQTLSTTWRTSRSLYRRWWRSQQPILLSVDGPARLTGCGSITGWVLARSGTIQSVEAWVNYQLIARCKPDHQRRDAHAAYPFYPCEQLAGFRLCPPVGILPDGKHSLLVKATDLEGHSTFVESLLTVDRFTMSDDAGMDADITGSNREYQLWLKHYDRHEIPEILNGPLISLVMPIYRPRIDHLMEAIASARQQTYQHWELCLCDDGSSNPNLTETLRAISSSEPRIKLTTLSYNQGISQATNQAIACSRGEFVALLDQDDRLHPQTLQAIAYQTQITPADVYYTDEDRLDARSRRLDPFFKPGWCPELLHSMMYLGHLCVYRRALLDRAGLCNSRFDGTQDWDLALRATEQPGCKVYHIPGVFYHWRLGGHSALEQNNRRCHELGREAVEMSLHRQDKAYRLETGPRACTFHLSPSANTPRVSILIPTRDNLGMLRRCLESIKQRTDYPDYEIIVIDNGSNQPEFLSYLASCPADRVLTINEPFNHSMLNNRAAEVATGDFLLLLNDDTEAISTHWLTSMVEQALGENVGAVGGWLIYPDGRTQHAGVMLEEAAVARHYSSAVMLDGLDRGLSLLNREVSAVTGACLLIRRELYFQSGGLDTEELPTSYNDVDLCLRLRSKGYRMIMTPRAKLIHHESATRRSDERDDRFRDIIRQRWLTELRQERFWNQHLGQSSDWHRGLAFHWPDKQ